MTPRKPQSALATAVRADLKRWGIDPKSALAAAALDLAKRLGEDDVRPSAAASLHAQLRATLGELAKTAVSAAEEVDPVDELRARREGRRNA